MEFKRNKTKKKAKKTVKASYETKSEFREENDLCQAKLFHFINKEPLIAALQDRTDPS